MCPALACPEMVAGELDAASAVGERLGETPAASSVSEAGTRVGVIAAFHWRRLFRRTSGMWGSTACYLVRSSSQSNRSPAVCRVAAGRAPFWLASRNSHAIA